MLCGRCKLVECTFEVVLLTSRHISDEYIDSLNDKNHLAYSRNVNYHHTHSTQIEYLSKFDFVENFVLGVRCSISKRVLATATLVKNQQEQLVNIGILIFRPFANRGSGHLILESVSSFCNEILPGFTQEIGTRVENIGMQRIAQKIGFKYSREEPDTKFVFYVRSFDLQENLRFFRVPPRLVVANDAGGAMHLAALLRAFGYSPLTKLTGPAVEIFDYFGIECRKSVSPNRENTGGYVLLGTSLFGGPESRALADPELSSMKKIALLDHWVNFQERFHPSGQLLPETFLVTNSIAYLIAKEKFPNSKILEIPDFLLAYMKLAYMKKNRVEDCALILLEPDSPTSFGQRFPQVDLRSLVDDVTRMAFDRGISKIVLRPHPAHSVKFIQELIMLFQGVSSVTVSRNSDLIDDFANANFVVGFHTYAMYLSSELGVNTFGYFTHATGHWTQQFPKIQHISHGQ